MKKFQGQPKLSPIWLSEEFGTFLHGPEMYFVTEIIVCLAAKSKEREQGRQKAGASA